MVYHKISSLIMGTQNKKINDIIFFKTAHDLLPETEAGTTAATAATEAKMTSNNKVEGSSLFPPTSDRSQLNGGILTMITESSKKQSHKVSDCARRVFVFYGAAGDKNDDEVTRCRICASTDWPREPIDFEKVNGRLLSNGTFEAVSWNLRDCYTWASSINIRTLNNNKHKNATSWVVTWRRF